MSVAPKLQTPAGGDWLVEAVKGEMTYLIYADSIKDARRKFREGDRGEVVEYQTHPAGVREIKRAPEEDE